MESFGLIRDVSLGLKRASVKRCPCRMKVGKVMKKQNFWNLKQERDG